MALDPSIIQKVDIVAGEKKDGSLEVVSVRGLTAQDMSILFSREEGAMAAIFSDAFDWSSGESIVEEIITRLPSLAAYAMALAAEDPDDAPIIARLPFTKQVEILGHVYRLTLPDEDSKKRMLEGLAVILSSFGLQS